ncbi:hypothetical protein BJ165DRAFT_1400666 [Panaeolus papilionaceus]|nr:hypothetical protein BJ165DRAFT_1400666 [Panaeolus papilionaceus]
MPESSKAVAKNAQSRDIPKHKEPEYNANRTQDQNKPRPKNHQNQAIEYTTQSTPSASLTKAQIIIQHPTSSQKKNKKQTKNEAHHHEKVTRIPIYVMVCKYVITIDDIHPYPCKIAENRRDANAHARSETETKIQSRNQESSRVQFKSLERPRLVQTQQFRVHPIARITSPKFQHRNDDDKGQRIQSRVYETCKGPCVLNRKWEWPSWIRSERGMGGIKTSGGPGEWMDLGPSSSGWRGKGGDGRWVGGKGRKGGEAVKKRE